MTFMPRRTRLLSATLAMIAAAGIALPAANAVTVPDSIRVALFLDLGSGKYQSTSPTVTLVGTGNLSLAWAGSASGPIDSQDTGSTVRFVMDGYKAMLLETSDFQAALTVLKKIQASSKSAFITKLTKKGKSVYQVTEGMYANAAQAKSALTKYTGAGVASGIQSLTEAYAAGPFAYEAGSYNSASEASAAAEQIGNNAGLDAFVAVKPSGSGTSYVVRVGQASDAGELGKIQVLASAAGLSLQPVAANSAYVVIRNDATYNSSASSTVPLYAVPSGGNVTLQASTAGDAGMQVVERSKRTYRGVMQVSVLNNNLALVNVVGLEPYLFSVVGAEIGGSWPAEAQKAQAVAARSYALSSGTGFQIADVVDTTNSQVYNGITSENAASTAGVKATAGEVLTSGGKIINAMFSANAGGITADSPEIYGNTVAYLAGAVTSPDDGPQKGKLDWYRVALSSGVVGYIRSDLLADQGQKNEAGVKVLTVTGSGVAVRPSPQIQSGVSALATVETGTQVVPMAKVPEYTNYSWVEGFTADQLLTSINARLSDKNKIQGPLKTLEVSETGASGRAVRLSANGAVVSLLGDSWRSALGGVKSTLFTIEETGRFTIMGANGSKTELPGGAESLQILGGNGATRQAGSSNLLILNGKGEVRAATTTPQFIITGKGYGHGLGLSQWGAKGLAEQGYDYQAILKYYYKNVELQKDG